MNLWSCHVFAVIVCVLVAVPDGAWHWCLLLLPSLAAHQYGVSTLKQHYLPPHHACLWPKSVACSFQACHSIVCVRGLYVADWHCAHAAASVSLKALMWL